MAATATDKTQSTNASAISADPAKCHSITKKHNKNINSAVNDTIRPTGNITLPSASTSQCMMLTDDETEHDCNKNFMTETQHQNNDDKIDSAHTNSTDIESITNSMQSSTPSRQVRQTKHNQLIKRNELIKGEIEQHYCDCIQIPIEHTNLVQDDKMMVARNVSSVSFFISSISIYLLCIFCFSICF